MTPAEDVRAELCPSGRLRVGVAVGPAVSALWSTRGPASGEPRGVTVDLGRLLAKKLEAVPELVIYSSSGAIIAAAASFEWDVAFTPVDAERKAKVDFGSDYFVGESTLMLRGDSDVKTLVEANRAGFRIAGVEHTATIRSVRRHMQEATVSGVSGLEDALQLLREGRADAVALGRESLESLIEAEPGYLILDEALHRTGTAVAVQKGKPAALAYVSEFVEDLKRDGTMRRISDAHGMKKSAVAPANSRS